MAEIIWTKEWSSADDGTIVSGQDLANIQSDISVGVTTNAVSLQGITVAVPEAADDGSALFYDHGNLKFDYLSRATILSLVYPIGAVVTLGVSTNPATLFGFGTWAAIKGKVIVGISNEVGDGAFDTLNETGGAQTVTLDTTMIPSHTHVVDNSTLPGDASGAGGSGSGWGHFDLDKASGATGGGLAHNNLQPYIVKYVWERTA